MRICALIIALALVAGEVRSQSTAASPAGNFHSLEFNLNADRQVVVPSLAYQYYFALGTRGNFLIGPGFRMYGISSGSNWRFAETNAPDDNFRDGDRTVNAFIADETRAAAFNLGIYMAYRIKRFEIGADTDILGFSTSKAVSGNFEVAGTGELIPVAGIRTETLTLFPINGTYNTGIIWAGWNMNKHSFFKVGITFVDVKYKVPREKLPEVNLPKEKFERIFTTISLGYAYRFRSR